MLRCSSVVGQLHQCFGVVEQSLGPGMLGQSLKLANNGQAGPDQRF